MECPRSPIQYQLEINAETFESLLASLNHEIFKLRQNGLVDGCWGGGGSNGSRVVKRNPITPEQYRAELERWSQEQRDAKTSDA